MRIKQRRSGNVSGLRSTAGAVSAAQLPKHLKRLESESVEIMREVVAELKTPVMLYSIGKDFERHASSGDESFLPRTTTVSILARRYNLEISRDDRLPRSNGTAA